MRVKLEVRLHTVRPSIVTGTMKTMTQINRTRNHNVSNCHTGVRHTNSAKGRRYSPRRALMCASFVLSFSAAFSQTTFNGRCQVVSSPLQVRTEGLTERLGDITLVCTGGAPGSVLSGNITLFFPRGSDEPCGHQQPDARCRRLGGYRQRVRAFGYRRAGFRQQHRLQRTQLRGAKR